MRKPIIGSVAVVLLALVGLMIAFVVGMRAKSPAVLNTVRRTSRAMKPLVMRSAGTPGAPASVIRHVGRVTGRSFETPVGAVAIDDGFVIALPYGPNTDWLRNVLASGSATIVDEGTTYDVDRPEVVALAVEERSFSPADQRAHRLFGVEQCLRVRRITPDETPQEHAGPT
jgi:deazaflavin-dependent oxidoreductase (nitroreductase family)